MALENYSFFKSVEGTRDFIKYLKNKNMNELSFFHHRIKNQNTVVPFFP